MLSPPRRAACQPRVRAPGSHSHSARNAHGESGAARRGSLGRVNQTLKRANPAPDLCRLLATGFPPACAETKHPPRRVIDFEGGSRPLAAPGAFRRIANLPGGALNQADRRNGVHAFFSERRLDHTAPSVVRRGFAREAAAGVAGGGPGRPSRGRPVAPRPSKGKFGLSVSRRASGSTLTLGTRSAIRWLRTFALERAFGRSTVIR